MIVLYNNVIPDATICWVIETRLFTVFPIFMFGRNILRRRHKQNL